MVDHPELFVLRHGETVWNREGRLQGRKDSPLTEKGKHQARNQRKLLTGFSHLPEDVFVSPLGRALQTAGLVVEFEDRLIVDDRLQETSFGSWEGCTKEEIREQLCGQSDEDTLSFGSPDGETFDMIRQRVSSFLNDLDRPAIVITHGATSSVMRGLCLGLDRKEIVNLSREQGCVFHLLRGREKIIRPSG